MLARATARLLVVFFLGAALGSAGCGGDRYIVVGSAQAPSVSGWLVIDDSEVTVHLEQLHPADRVDPALHTYVLWFEPGRGAPVRAGTLKYSPDNRTGELRAHAPFGNFVVKVTAEANDKPAVPSDFVVASQAIVLED